MLNLIFLISISVFMINSYAQDEIGVDSETNTTKEMTHWNPADIDYSENSFSEQSGEWCEINGDLKLTVKVKVKNMIPRFDNKFFSKTKNGVWHSVEDPLYGHNSNIIYDEDQVTYSACAQEPKNSCKKINLIFKRCAPLLS